MFSLKAIIESAVVQGKAILHTTRTKACKIQDRKTFLNNNLTELHTPSGVGRTGLNNLKPSRGSISSVSTIAVRRPGGTSIADLLRPVTSRFLEGLRQRASNPLWAETRRRNIKRLFGQTAPYFALVGVTLVSGPDQGLLTAKDELEALCGDIREAISRAGWLHNPDFWKFRGEAPVEGSKFSLGDFELGSVIDKGCNAVVYAAKLVEDADLKNGTDDTISSHTSTHNGDSTLNVAACSLPPISDIFQTNAEQREWDSSTRIHACLLSSDDATVIKETPLFGAESIMPTSTDHLTAPLFQPLSNNRNHPTLDDSSAECNSKQSSISADIDNLLSTGAFKKLKKKKVRFKGLSSLPKSGPDDSKRTAACTPPSLGGPKSCIQEYPLAIKMLFNYEAESNTPAILNAMYKELLPARNLQLDQNAIVWKEKFLSKRGQLPPHLNVVEMPCVFVDRVRLLDGGLDLYPEALPKRLNPTGFGRNMSLFCVMKRYDFSLAEYLTRYKPSPRTSLLLLTQLFEGILHLNKNGIVHRDLKADNLLVSISEEWAQPRLVITDFGCCLSDPSRRMKVHFSSYDSDPRLGNAALMAPEVKCAVPGLLSSINFSSADLWAAGAIAFEIFGLENPFFSQDVAKGFLDSATYKENQLPRLPKFHPSPVRKLIYDVLKRNPKQRPSPIIAATICQLTLWAPSKWLQKHALSMPSHDEVTKWLLCLSTKVLCEAGLGNCQSGEQRGPHMLEYEIVSTFLSRVHYEDIHNAIRWLRAF